MLVQGCTSGQALAEETRLYIHARDKRRYSAEGSGVRGETTGVRKVAAALGCDMEYFPVGLLCHPTRSP